MKALFATVIASVLSFGLVCSAQSMIEYSHVAAKPPAGMQTLGSHLNGALAKAADGTNAQQSPAGSQVKEVPPTQEAVAKPTPPTVFVLSNGKQVESNHYVLTAKDVQIQDGAAPQTIPLSNLNRTATVEANQKRGIDLKIPTSQSQMTLSF